MQANKPYVYRSSWFSKRLASAKIMLGCPSGGGVCVRNYYRSAVRAHSRRLTTLAPSYTRVARCRHMNSVTGDPHMPTRQSSV